MVCTLVLIPLAEQAAPEFFIVFQAALVVRQGFFTDK